ncbi:hypothetical protein AURDEDRAFT_171927 [Auricularia subglabra TFB-10046 SS5]|nr:hypothetical protein AURDEDRAFT_171927 [Auricularia subglabra TFB-10046 SS5]
MIHSVLAAPRDPVTFFSTDLLLYLLKYFSFDELIPLLSVSTSWRAIALDCPAYWSLITLGSLKEGATNLFLIRIARSLSRPISVALDFGDPGLSVSRVEVAEAAVLSALADHLYHTVQLAAYLHTVDLPRFWRTLELPAAELVYLRLHILLSGHEQASVMPAIPPALFGGHCPRLRSLAIKDLVLPSEPVRALSQVTTALVAFTINGVPMPDVFRHCPDLETIVLPGSASYNHPVYGLRSSFTNVKNCYWLSQPSAFDRRLVEAVRDVRKVSIGFAHPYEISRAVGHLTPPFVFAFTRDGDAVYDRFELSVSEYDRPSSRLRIFSKCGPFSDTPPGPGLRRAWTGALAHNVHVLDVQASSWKALMQSIGFVPGVKCLRIRLSGGDDLTALSCVTQPPDTVHTLELVSRDCLGISETIQGSAVSGILGRSVARSVTLALSNIHILDGALPKDAFKNVIFSHDHARCRFKSAQSS